MKNTLDNFSIKTVCVICGTPLNGFNLLKRGNDYYCESDFQRTSPEELRANEKTEREYNNYKKLFNSEC